MAKAFMQAYSQAVASTFFFLSALMFWYLNLCTDAGKGGQEAAKAAAQTVVRGRRMDRKQALDILNLSSSSPAIDEVLQVCSSSSFCFFMSNVENF